MMPMTIRTMIELGELQIQKIARPTLLEMDALIHREPVQDAKPVCYVCRDPNEPAMPYRGRGLCYSCLVLRARIGR
jgi:hypothetical protein